MTDDGDATKHPRLAELEGMVRDGRIDTIVVAFTDMQGRLLGKRVQGQALLDGVVEQETYDSMVHPWDREHYLERG